MAESFNLKICGWVWKVNLNKQCFAFIILLSLSLLVSCTHKGEFQNLNDAKKR